MSSIKACNLSYYRIIELFLMIILVFTFYDVKSQVQHFNPLEVGDKVPDIKLQSILNYRSPEIRLNELRGKLVILDFWNKYCSSCISAFPKMERLQKQFNGKVQILLVTPDTREDLRDLFKRSEIVRSVKLPIVTSDEALNQIFPHTSVPFYAWIDPNGEVVATTNGYAVTAENIGKILAGNIRNSGIVMRKDVDYDTDKSLLDIDSMKAKEMLSFSVIRGPLTGTAVQGAYSLYLKNTRSGMRLINSSIINLYSIAFGPISEARIVLDLQDKDRYYRPVDESKMDEWLLNNTYCYEMKVPYRVTREHLKNIMKKDLELTFNLTGKMEKRLLKTYSLVRTKSTNDKDLDRKFRETHSVRNTRPDQDSTRILYDATLSYYIILLSVNDNNKKNNWLFEDQTGYKGRVEMEVPANLTNIPLVKALLNKYGLDLIESEKEVEVLVLKRSNRFAQR